MVDLKLAGMIIWSTAVGMAAYTPPTLRTHLAERLRHPLLTDDTALAVLMQSARHHPVKIPPLLTFTDSQLQSIQAPVHVLAGAKSPVFDGERLVDRINRHLPRGQARLLPDAGHAFPISHLDESVAMVRRALASD